MAVETLAALHWGGLKKSKSPAGHGGTYNGAASLADKAPTKHIPPRTTRRMMSKIRVKTIE
jgi:hypothetical protein